MLVDRDRELARLSEMLRQCPTGTGGFAVIRGGTAIGKTELLHALGDHAAGQGFRVLRAIGSPAERSFPYALVEQLFPDAADITGPAPAEDTAVPPRTLRHIHRSALALAAERPLLLCVDDLQHADPASLQCLLYLIWRLRTAPIALVVTESPHGEADRTLFGELQYQPGICRIDLAPLSAAGVTELVAAELGADAAERLAGRFHAVSGGNPLLLKALLNDADDGRPQPTAPPELVIAGAFQAAARACVHRGGSDTVAVAQGLAVLGDVSGMAARSTLCVLTGVSSRTADHALQALAASALLEGGRFRHDALRSALLADLSTAEHTELRARAARLLQTQGAPPTAVAEQLLAGGPLGESWEAPLLRAAAEAHLAAGEVARAGRCLRLAVVCADDSPQGLADRMATAALAWRLDPKGVIPQLRALTEQAQAGLLPPHTVLPLVEGLLWHGLEEEAAAASQGLPRDGYDAPLSGSLSVTHLKLAATYPGVLPKLSEPLSRPRPGGPRQRQLPARESPDLVAARAVYTALTGGDHNEVMAGAERVLQSTRLGQHSLEPLIAAVHSLIYIDRLGAADSWCDRLLARAAKQHAPVWDALLHLTKALIALRKGSLPAALEHGQRALELVPGEGWGVGIALPLAVLIETHTARGEQERAAELLDLPVPPAAFHTTFGIHYQHARGVHNLANGQYQAALSCFLACGESLQAWGLDSPGLVPWRTGAAEAWIRLDKPANATRLLNEQLSHPGYRQPRALGAALRVLAATRSPAQRPILLGRAVEMLQAGGDRYTMARTLAELSQVQLRLGNGREARQLSLRAWRTAEECGAEELQRSLLPAATRPPGPGHLKPPARSGGTHPLTDAEHRVAALAAQGYTNREVAAKLSITVSTVEQHLTRVYRKFRIKHRRQLAASLGFETAEPA